MTWVADFTFTLNDVKDLVRALETSDSTNIELYDSLVKAIESAEFYKAIEPDTPNLQ